MFKASFETTQVKIFDVLFVVRLGQIWSYESEDRHTLAE